MSFKALVPKQYKAGDKGQHVWKFDDYRKYERVLFIYKCQTARKKEAQCPVQCPIQSLCREPSVDGLRSPVDRRTYLTSCVKSQIALSLL
jgi:hypothetical protein